MTWRLLFAVIGLSITGLATFAQEPPRAERLASGRPGPQNGEPENRGLENRGFEDRGPENRGLENRGPENLGQPIEDDLEVIPESGFKDAGFFSGTGVVRFHLVQGRLCLDAPRHRKGSQSSQDGEIYESITVTAQRGIPSMHYVCQTPEHHVTLSVQGAHQVRIESWLPERKLRSVIEHDQYAPLSWKRIGSDGVTARHTAATMLHLRQADRQAFDSHFGGLVRRLLRGQSLCSLGRQTHQAMLAETDREVVCTVPEVIRCVERLHSPTRRDRALAERQLLSWGTPVLAAFRLIDQQDLDAEQRDRLAYIVRRLRPGTPDTPASLAKMLVNDGDYWASIAGTLNPNQAALAQQHLDRIAPTAGHWTIGTPNDSPAAHIATN